jgi:Flp pilus assembly pilin Flp
MTETETESQPTSKSKEDHGQGMVEYGILIGTLALGVVLTLLAIGTQIRTVMTETPPQHIGEP